jgi:hypothetical protein
MKRPYEPPTLRLLANVNEVKLGSHLSLVIPGNTEILDQDPRRKRIGHCAIGLYLGMREFHQTGARVFGVFGMVGVEEPCEGLVYVKCLRHFGGIPFYWYACERPEHRVDAEEVWHLSPEGRTVKHEVFERRKCKGRGPNSSVSSEYRTKTRLRKKSKRLKP